MNKYVNESIWNFTKLKWLEQYMIGHKGFIAGGCFKNIFLNEKVKDIDIFFKNDLDYNEAIIYYDKQEDFILYYENDKVRAYKEKNKNIVIELINTTYGNPKDIILNFDFSITKFTLFKQRTYNEDTGEDETEYRVLYHSKFFEDLTMRRLVVGENLPFPANTFDRMFRYGKYGFFPCRETKMRILEEINKMDNIPELSMSLYEGMD